MNIPLQTPTKQREQPYCTWKPDWNRTARHYTDWWKQKGYLIGSYWKPLVVDKPIEPVNRPTQPPTLEASWTDPAYVCDRIHSDLANRAYPGDFIPLAEPSLGPGSLALWLGSRPEFSAETVWYHPCAESTAQLAPLEFDPGHPWFKTTLEQLQKVKARSQGRYLVGCPDLIEGLDTLASLVGAENLLTDMLESPDTVHARLREINRVWFQSYEAIYDLIKEEDGSSAFWAFFLWGRGKTAKIQCDLSAMFSSAMFAEFVVPYLREQCRYLDYSMYHLDGTQCIPHLDLLLGMEELDAIEWTPQICAGISTGGAPEWHDMYRRIKAAGKSVQVVNIFPDEIIPLFDAVGPDGMFILTEFKNLDEAEKFMTDVEQRFPRR